MSNVIDIVVKSKDETKGGFSSADKSVSSFGDKMKNVNKVAVGASIGIAVGLGKIAKDSVGVSRRLGEMDAKASAVFEDSRGRVQSWAEANKKAFGTSSTEVEALAANFADLLKPMGFTADQAADMATKTLDLSGALAKWSGGQYEAAEVSEILSKAMLGERDQLKSLGISINEADVKARLAKKGQEELTGAAKQQAVALATQELILEKSTDAQAAWADGGKEAAEAEGALASATTTTSESVAKALTPAIEKGTEALAKFADWASKNQGTVMTLGVALGGLAVSVLAVNAAYKVYRAVVLVATAAQWALNSALFSNPIGLVVLALVAIAAAVVVAYKKSETFRGIVDKMWAGLKKLGSWLAGAAVAQWGAFKAAIDAVAKAGKWLWDKALRPTFRFIVNGVANLLDMWAAMLRALSKVPGFGWAKGAADAMSGAAAKARGLADDIRGIPNKTVKVTVEYGSRGEIPSGFGPVHTPRKAAHGGIGGGLTMVGERGRELVRLPHGSTVIPNGTTENMMAGGGGGRTVIELRSSGSRVDDMLLELLRNAIRVRGGNVQVVLGRA